MMRHALISAGIVLGLLVPAAAPHGASAALIGDVNDDCSVNVLDLSLVAGSYLTGVGSLLYKPQYDLNSDGVINILDIQTVAGHFGDVLC